MGKSIRRQHMCTGLMLVVALMGGFGGRAAGQPAARPAPVWTSAHPSFAVIDKHALQASVEAEGSVATLAAYLVQPAKNDAHKARAIFRWVTDRIAYNAEDFAAKKFGEATPEKTLTTRKATCAGYSCLFKALCDEAKVECLTIAGYVKDGIIAPGDQIRANHGWNAVKLDGRWYLLDATWGAGDMNPQTRKWEKRFREYYFLTPPERLIFSHFPETAEQQLLQPAVTAKQFHQFLLVPREFLVYGVPTKEIMSRVDAQGFRGFAGVTWDGTFPLRIIEAPLERHLKQGQTYRFRFEATACPKMFLALNGIGQEMRRQGQVFELTLTPTPGKLQIGAVFNGKGTGPWAFLEYDVE